MLRSGQVISDPLAHPLEWKEGKRLMEGFELAILLTTAGAVVGAAFIKTIVSAAKGIGIVPETGRGVLIAVGLCAALLMGLAVWDSTLLTDGVDASDVLLIVLSFLGLYTASIGVHETAVKAQNIIQGTTNPTGPDA